MLYNLKNSRFQKFKIINSYYINSLVKQKSLIMQIINSSKSFSDDKYDNFFISFNEFGQEIKFYNNNLEYLGN